MAPISSGLGEIFQFEVRGDGLPAADRAMVLRTCSSRRSRPGCASVPGVVEINTFGGELRTYQVEVTPERLASYGVSLDDLFTALEQNNANVGGGYLVKGREQTLVRGVALYETSRTSRRWSSTRPPRAHRSPSACSGPSCSPR
jgi:cobalt-zinc-cadmium resistance protein CzcA